MVGGEFILPRREQLLIVKDPGNLVGLLRDRYPQLEITSADSYMDGITAMADRHPRGLLVGVEPDAPKIDSAVSGLRKAAGSESRIVLCCRPSGEPTTRQVVSAGADDYLIYPPTGDELDDALALAPTDSSIIEVPDSPPLPSWEELASLTSLLTDVAGGKGRMLHRVCELVSETMRAPFVRIVADEDMAIIGDQNTTPALVEPIMSGGRNFGQVHVGARQRSPFSGSEARKLVEFAKLIGHLLATAEQMRNWQKLAMTDTVTALPNRRQLMQSLEALLARATAERFCVTVVIFDLDGFKHFNDTYGHDAGDEILRDTAKLLRRHSRQHDIISRYAGDEFVAVFWDAEEPRTAGSKHPSSALDVLNRFRNALGSHEFPKLGPESRGHVTISAGLATFPWDGNDVEVLIDRADKALLRAKREGKDRISLVGEEPADNV